MSKEEMTLAKFLDSIWGSNIKSKEEIEYENELKATKIHRCPLCGGEAEVESYSESYGHERWKKFNVVCKDCNITLNNTYYNELEAIKAWNKLIEKRR